MKTRLKQMKSIERDKKNVQHKKTKQNEKRVGCPIK